jgi:ATPase family AAA domain-containing protein 3A/B
MSAVDEHMMKEVAKSTKGFSGRQLAKLAASVQGAVFGSTDAALTPDRLRDMLADGQLHHKA